MANPLRIKATGGGTFLGLQEMQASEMDYAVHQVLTEFNTDNVGTGTLNIGAGGTSRGTFNDTVFNHDVGQHPVAGTDFAQQHTQHIKTQHLFLSRACLIHYLLMTLGMLQNIQTISTQY